MLTDAVRELPEGRFTLRQKSALKRADAAGPGTLPVTKSPAGAVSEGEPAPYPRVSRRSCPCLSLPCFLISAFFIFLFCSVLLCPPRGPGNAGHSRLFPGSFQTGGISPQCRAPFLFSAVIRVSSFSFGFLIFSHRGQVKRTRQGPALSCRFPFGPGATEGTPDLRPFPVEGGEM